MVAPSKPPMPHGMMRRSAGLVHSRLFLGQSRHELKVITEGWLQSNGVRTAYYIRPGSVTQTIKDITLLWVQ
jgi:hypothetical protein